MFGSKCCVLLAGFVLAVLAGSGHAQVCDWSTYSNCTTILSNVSLETDAAIQCRLLRKGEECLLAIEDQCTEAAIKESVDGTLEKLENEIDSAGCNGAGAIECTWGVFTACTDPLSSLAEEENMMILCPTLGKGKDCLDKLNKVCPQGVIKSTIATTMPKVTSTLTTYCGEGCSLYEYQKCAEQMPSMNETNLDIVCPKLQTSLDCFEKIDTCPEGDVKTTIDSTMTEAKKNLNIYCDSTDNGECTWPVFTQCTDPLVPLAGEEDMTILCPALEKGKACLDQMDEDCPDGDIKSTIATTMSQVTTPLAAYCGEGCTWYEYQKCTKQFASKDETNLKIACPATESGLDCLYTLDKSCPNGDVKTTIDSTVAEAKRNYDIYCDSKDDGCSWDDYLICSNQFPTVDDTNIDTVCL